MSINRAGFTLIKALLSIALFAILATVFISSLIYGQDSERLAGDRARATFLAEEGLEAARNMRDADLANLTAGNHGLAVSGNSWNFSGTSDTTDIFTRQIVVADTDAKTKTITANVSWQQNAQRNDTVTLTSRLTDWKIVNPTEAEQILFHTNNSQIQAGLRPKIYDVTMENIGIENIAIASSEISWSGVSSGAHLMEITMDGNSVWTGDDVSGSSQDIDDFTLVFGDGTYPLEFIFDKAINGITITVAFAMTDGSIKIVIFTPGEPADTTAPDDVTDLTVSGATTSSLDLDWTAPGDDGDSGTATSYDIRYSTSNITSGNWSSATQVSGEPDPSSAGHEESMTVFGLSSGTTYYFAMKTSDEVPNESDLSNVSTGATSALPQSGYLVVNTATVITGGSGNKDILNITLQNSGPASIIINSMTTSWSGVAANRRMNFININGITVWTGAVASGTTNIFSPVVTLASGAPAIPITYLRFNQGVQGIILSLTFNMSDGSTKTVSNIGPIL